MHRSRHVSGDEPPGRQGRIPRSSGSVQAHRVRGSRSRGQIRGTARRSRIRGHEEEPRASRGGRARGDRRQKGHRREGEGTWP